MKEQEKNKDEFDFTGTYQKKYENVKNLLQSALNQIEKIQNIIDNMEREERKAHYQSIPGTEGVFDGQYLVAQDGRKTEVPPNYAAKSKLVYGDILKVFTDSGRQIFKQIDRVERRVIEGVLTKKEGKWYLLSDVGSYKISDASAEFNSAELNDRAVALIPAENTKVPFACLDKVLKNSEDAKSSVEIEGKKKLKTDVHKNADRGVKASADRNSFTLKHGGKDTTRQGLKNAKSMKKLNNSNNVSGSVNKKMKKDSESAGSKKIIEESSPAEKTKASYNALEDDDLR